MNAQLDLPYQSHSWTSQAAAESVTTAETDRQRVLKYIRAAYGATDEMIATALCLNPSTARPRRVELVRLGLIVDSGRTRLTSSGRAATIWESAT
jgi:hypothetical protein